jgi:hypothetical protein
MSLQSNWTWFLLALVPAVASQIVRMGQTDPVAWAACDYAGRLGTLAVLAAIPTARRVAFARETLEVSWSELVIWVVCLLAFELIISWSIAWIIDWVIRGTQLAVDFRPAIGCTPWMSPSALRWLPTKKKSCSGVARVQC